MKASLDEDNDIRGRGLDLPDDASAINENILKILKSG